MVTEVPLVSVVIPTYNRSAFVVRAIDSVLSQLFTDYEIIVVDDGSTDATENSLKKYGNKINYIYQDNAGVSAARNTGITLARGEWIAFLDSDDEWRADYLFKQMERVKDFPGTTMQTANCLFIGLDGRTETYFEINGSLSKFNGMDYVLIEDPFCFIVKHGPWQVGSTIIRRKAITEAGLFDTSIRFAEDFDLMARVALQGPFGLIKEDLVDIYRREEAIDCLTKQIQKELIKARESGEKILEKLKKIESLNHHERKALSELLSANRRAIGNLLLEEGKNTSAKDAYKCAFFMSPSIPSGGKYILSLLPPGVNQYINNWYLNLKNKQ